MSTRTLRFNRKTLPVFLLLVLLSVSACAPQTTGVDFDGRKEQTSTSVSVSGQAEVRGDAVVNATTKVTEADTVIVNEVGFIYMILLALGWLLPSPNELGRWIRELLFRKKQ